MALKNNNPGNIRSFIKNGKYSTPFIGETLPPDIKPGKTAGFRVFTSLPYGYRALFKVLKSGYLDKGINTINKIFPIYAPASDNNVPTAYINAVVKMTGINKDTILKNYTDLLPIVKAITKVETGTAANDAAILEGFNLIGDTTGPTQPTQPTETQNLPDPGNELKKVFNFIKNNKKKILISAAAALLIYITYEKKRTKFN
jgi:hypothetical protein